MKLEKESLTILRKAIETLEDGFTELPDLKSYQKKISTLPN